MSTPAPVYVGLLLVIPALQIPLASFFGLDLAFIPPLALLSVQYFAASYTLHYLKKPFISGACRMAGLDELSIHSAQWTADNLQFCSMILGYVGILLSVQGDWSEGQIGAAAAGIGFPGLLLLGAINAVNDSAHTALRQALVSSTPKVEADPVEKSTGGTPK